MRWSLRCTSTGSQAVALPCGASSSATTSASKKSLRAAEQDRPDVARARRCWKRRQAMLTSTRLVFIDETAANTKMVRLSGRCPRGERLIGRVPQGHWKTITFVARFEGDPPYDLPLAQSAEAQAEGIYVELVLAYPFP